MSLHSMESPAVRRLGVLGDHVVQEADTVVPRGSTPEERRQFIARRHYGVFLPETLRDDIPWNVVRSAMSPEKLLSTFPAPDDKIRTLYDNLENSTRKFPKAPYLGTRGKRGDGRYGPYEWISFSEAARIRTEIGSGLLHLGLGPGSTVGIFSMNCQEWVLLDAACHAYSMTTVPLYDTLGPDVVSFICNHADVKVVGCNAMALKTLLECLSKCSTIVAIVVWDIEDDLLPATPLSVNCQILSIRQLVALGTQNLKPHVPPKGEDVALICYTSGTTGLPKGAMLTHKSLIANAAGNVVLIHDPIQGHRHLSYLPLAHIYERLNLTLATFMGTAYGFYHGDIVTILEDVLELKPTLFSSVPRLYNRIYDKVMVVVPSDSIDSTTAFDGDSCLYYDHFHVDLDLVISLDYLRPSVLTFGRAAFSLWLKLKTGKTGSE